jgi:signal peptidase I
MMKLLKKIANAVLNICFYSCLLAVLWGVLQVFCFTSFRIPTDSMEPALLPGDNIIVNKLVGGARLFDVFAALNKEEVDIHRLPGLGTFKRNDVLVFNFPYTAGWDRIGFDVMKYYVKRCIGLPGDTLEIRNGYFHINGEDRELGNREMQHVISGLSDTAGQHIAMKAYPWDEEMGWTIKDFGPLFIPSVGRQVEMNRTNWLLYHRLISWEQNEPLVLKEDRRVYLGDSLITAYRFEHNYYFMGGDQLTNSQDSRYWGLLPEAFIVGRADYVWLSKNKRTGKMRWERLMKKIQ